MQLVAGATAPRVAGSAIAVGGWSSAPSGVPANGRLNRQSGEPLVAASVSFLVARLGVLRLTLGTVAGQLAFGVVLVAVFPTGGGLAVASVVAAACTLVAVVVASR